MRRFKIGDKVSIPAYPDLGSGEVYYTEDYPEGGGGEERQFVGAEMADGRVVRAPASAFKKARKEQVAAP